MYINALGNISPQDTFTNEVSIRKNITISSQQFNCVEPEYKTLLDAKSIRRMSRIIRMGTAAAITCIQRSSILQPDAIVVGTAYGCLEDTSMFLSKMIENNEELLTPTAFIHSTHNTIAAQIALLINCHNYNNTFVHRGFSFEHALLDAKMLMNEKEAQYVLVGGLDEITSNSQLILSRFCTYKKKSELSLDFFNSKTKGTIGGEGAAFFMLTTALSENNYAKLEAFTTFYKPKNEEDILARILNFLAQQNCELEEIDLVLLGMNGDVKTDSIYHKVSQKLFKENSIVVYKHLCGEFPTASSFALWYAAHSIKNARLPFNERPINKPFKQVKKIVIYNHYLEIYHSLFLLESC